MRKFIARYYRLLDVLLVFTVAILIVPVTLQMISRFTALIPAWIWTEEMARFLFIWMIMIGAMIGVRESAHHRVELGEHPGPRRHLAESLSRVEHDRLARDVRLRQPTPQPIVHRTSHRRLQQIRRRRASIGPVPFRAAH